MRAPAGDFFGTPRQESGYLLFLNRRRVFHLTPSDLSQSRSTFTIPFNASKNHYNFSGVKEDNEVEFNKWKWAITNINEK